MIKVIIDPDSTALQERCALIKTPRRSRKRYPEGCVELVENEAQARHMADPLRQRYAAVVYGPSVSSESQRIYYLVRWL